MKYRVWGYDKLVGWKKYGWEDLEHTKAHKMCRDMKKVMPYFKWEVRVA